MALTSYLHLTTNFLRLIDSMFIRSAPTESINDRDILLQITKVNGGKSQKDRKNPPNDKSYFTTLINDVYIDWFVSTVESWFEPGIE